ncbi:MAG: 2-oxo acid dehydrogenase subunit E2 [Fuerstiella sp.]|nr:2-oxo acid dehydrogenase subunit E2 [Fuerstiella sp.]
MTIVFKLPEVSEGVESVDIAEITVAPGDVIEAGTIICEVETDKAATDIECPYAGTVKEILITAGDSVAIDAPLLVIEESGATNVETPAPSAAPQAASEGSVPAQDTAETSPKAPADTGTPAELEFSLQEVSEGVTAVDIAEVMVSTGDIIKSGTIICEVETDKAVAEIECPHPGTITAVHVASGDNVEVGAPLITIETIASGTADSKVSAGPAPPEATEPPPSDDVPEAPKSEMSPKSSVPVNDGQPPPPAGPATRRLARKLGVDLAQVTGTARGGRITIEDVEGFVRAKLTEPAAGATSLSPGMIQAAALPDFSQFGPVEREPLNKIYRSAASNLHASWLTIPHVTQHDLADITELEIARKRYVQSNPQSPKITMTAITIKAVVGALRAFPHFNSSLDMETGEWVLKRYYHIGVAVDTPKGLVVPVIRNCDQKNVLQVAAELADLAERARERKLKSAEMRGASFTITNLGGIGGTCFTPIVNHPEVAILGLSRSQKHLKLEDGKVVERVMLPLSMSYDHRAVNGADAARFIVKLSGSLTNLFELF